MSIVKSSAVMAAGAGSENGLPMLTPEEFIEQVRALRARVPDLESPPKERQTEYLKRVAKLDPEFTREAIGAVGASEVVQAVLGNTPEDLVHAEDEMNRWSLGETELRSLLHSLSTANLVRRQRIGQAALEAYGVSTRLAKREEHAHLAPLVQHMRRLRKLGRRRPRAAAEPEPQLPPPQTKPV